ncbi:MAG: DUF1425 domain-containing protein [candidate division WOR-3 bacterium]|jgi:uncharacterized protein YcfL
MKRINRWLSLVLAASLLTVCAQTINSLWINRETGSRRWVINNPVLAGDIRVLDVKEEESDGALLVSVLLKNGWHMPIGGKVKMLFYDQNGVQLDDPWGWHQVNLEANQEQWVKFVAPRPAGQISRMKLMIRGINRYSAAQP